jgi:hypothetical protein
MPEVPRASPAFFVFWDPHTCIDGHVTIATRQIARAGHKNFLIAHRAGASAASLLALRAKESRCKLRCKFTLVLAKHPKACLSPTDSPSV